MYMCVCIYIYIMCSASNSDIDGACEENGKTNDDNVLHNGRKQIGQEEMSSIDKEGNDDDNTENKVIKMNSEKERDDKEGKERNGDNPLKDKGKNNYLTKKKSNKEVRMNKKGIYH